MMLRSNSKVWNLSSTPEVWLLVFGFINPQLVNAFHYEMQNKDTEWDKDYSTASLYVCQGSGAW